jgi:hypothetical protein
MHLEEVIRNSSKFFGFTALNLLLILLLAAHAVSQQKPTDAESASFARRLKLTDLCLFTEARYTRHPAMADNHAAFQEHPSALDHFPSGSILMPLKNSGSRR